MKIVPTPLCVNILKSYGIIFKEIDGTYLLINRLDEINGSLLRSLKKPLTLSFKILCTDNLLLNYSDLTLTDMNYGFLLTNKNKDSTKLHTGDCISDANKVLLISHFQLLDAYILNKEDMLRLTTCDDNQTELFKGTVENLRKEISFSTLLEIGRFAVYVGVSSDPMLCYAVASNPMQVFGMLEMDISPEMLTNQEIAYTATIGSKSVFWRYHIINREQVAYTDFKLFSGKNVVEIEKEFQTVLGTGDKAYVLETTQSIVMSERYDTFYELEFVKSDLKSGQVLSKKRVGLPVPEINRIKISKNELGYKAYSDMFIYV